VPRARLRRGRGPPVQSPTRPAYAAAARAAADAAYAAADAAADAAYAAAGAAAYAREISVALVIAEIDRAEDEANHAA